MDIKTAYHYTREFKGFFCMEKPVELQEVMIYQRKMLKNGVVYFRTTTNIKKVSLNVFLKKYAKYFDLSEINDLKKDLTDEYKEEYDLYTTKTYYIKPKKTGLLYICSKGLITIDDYFLAQDIMEQIIPIRKNEMIVDNTYKSILDKEYIYLGKVKVNASLVSDFSIEEEEIIDDLLLDVSFKRLVYRSNIVLLEDIGIVDSNRYINEIEIMRKLSIFNGFLAAGTIVINDFTQIT